MWGLIFVPGILIFYLLKGDYMVYDLVSRDWGGGVGSLALINLAEGSVHSARRPLTRHSVLLQGAVLGSPMQEFSLQQSCKWEVNLP